MHCPTLMELPPCPSHKNGWPWTEESPQSASRMPDKSRWPKISIVTPSYNQGRFIEETIRATLLQGYPELEYIVIDGGSTDGTIEIIKKYEKWITEWRSEPDKGQSHAINKGFDLSNGEIVAWINSDDFYFKNALRKVAEFFRSNSKTDMIFGDCHAINEKSEVVKLHETPKRFDLRRLIARDCYINQPSTFFTKKVICKVGGLCESLEYSMDYDLWIKIGQQGNVKRINEVLSFFRRHPDAKTCIKANNPLQYHENMKIRKRYGGFKQTYEYYRHRVLDGIKAVVR